MSLPDENQSTGDGAVLRTVTTVNERERLYRLSVLADALLTAVREHADNRVAQTSSGTMNGAR